MQPSKWQRALVLLIGCCFLATSCTTTRVTPFPNEQTPNAMPAVSVGDTVKVTLRTGAVRTFKVTALEADGLAGKKLRVPYKDMQLLEIRKVSGWRTLGIGVGLVLVAAATALAILINADRGSD